jgi:hypothetical protein
LTASDADAGNSFEGALSVSGDTLIVGSAHTDDAGPDSGSVYIFVRVGTSWQQQAKLSAADGADGDQFGHSVSVDGNTAIVGAYSKASNRGAA